jgi:hypothetical protein
LLPCVSYYTHTIGFALQTQLDSFFSSWMAGGNGVTLTPKGLALAGSQGQLGNAANAALLGLVYGRYSGGADGILRACWARRQVTLSSITCILFLGGLISISSAPK